MSGTRVYVGPQGLLRQFWACAEFCSSLRGSFGWNLLFAGLAANVAADGAQIRLEAVFPLGTRAPSTMLSGW